MATSHVCKNAKGKSVWRAGGVNECDRPQVHGRRVQNRIAVPGADTMKGERMGG